MIKLIVGVIAAALLAIILWSTFAEPANACWWCTEPTSDKAMRQQSEQQQKDIDMQAGFPAIVNGFEKRMVRMLYEMRDDPEYRTHTYIVTMTGEFIKVCDSVGYGINASIQFSNPSKPYRYSNTSIGYAMPQAEPNGLFMPEGLAATYVMCINGEELNPVYVEPEVLVSPFPMTEE